MESEKKEVTTIYKEKKRKRKKNKGKKRKKAKEKRIRLPQFESCSERNCS